MSFTNDLIARLLRREDELRAELDRVMAARAALGPRAAVAEALKAHDASHALARSAGAFEEPAEVLVLVLDGLDTAAKLAVRLGNPRGPVTRCLRALRREGLVELDAANHWRPTELARQLDLESAPSRWAQAAMR
jgi:hypothetical protein